MSLGVFDELCAGLNVPFAPGRNNLDRRIERIGGQLKANLVIALAGGAMRNGIGTYLSCCGDQVLGD